MAQNPDSDLLSFVILNDRPQIKDPDMQFFRSGSEHFALLHYHVCWVIKFLQYEQYEDKHADMLSVKGADSTQTLQIYPSIDFMFYLFLLFNAHI